MYTNPDNDQRGKWMTKPLASPDNSPNKKSEIFKEWYKKIAKWRCSQKTYDEYLKNDLVIPNDDKGKPRVKIFLEDNQGQIPNSLFNVATNEQGSNQK